MPDQLRQTYFPSCRVRLTIRFEDWGATDAPAGPAKPPHLRRGTKDDAPLKVERVDGRFELVAPGASTNAGGPQGKVAEDGRTFVVDGIVPLTCEVRRLGIREADECSITIAHADFPFDPRAVRACAVEAFLGTITVDEYRRGISGQTRADAAADTGASGGEGDAGSPVSVVADAYLDPYGVQRSNLRFAGWAEDFSIDFDDGEPIVTLECADNTKLIADQTAPPKLALSSSLPLDEAVATYLANFPQCEGLTVEMRPLDSPRPKLKDALSKSANKPDLGPPPDGKSTALDYLADCVMAVGFMIWVEGTRVVIQKPRTLYAGTAVRPGDPFTGRRLPSGRVTQRRLLVWGINLDELSVSRKFGRKTGSSVEVRCYSGRQKRTLVARHPSKGQRPTNATPGGQTEEKWRVVEVAGIESEEALRSIAQAVYEATNRNEMLLKVKTMCLGSLGGSNDDPDLLDVEPGDALDVERSRGEFAEDADVSLGPGQEDTPERVSQYLQRVGYGADVSKAYANALGATQLPTTFRVRTWSLAWEDSGEGGGGGITVSGELMTYAEARLDKGLPDGEEPATNEATGSPVVVRAD